MSGPNAPSPAPRSASTGPNGLLATTGASLVNGVGAAAVAGSGVPMQPTGASTATGASTISQLNLNQIVSNPPILVIFCLLFWSRMLCKSVVRHYIPITISVCLPHNGRLMIDPPPDLTFLLATRYIGDLHDIEHQFCTVLLC